MKKIDFGPDEEFIKNYKELKSSRKMGELYGCQKTTVLNHAKKIGFDPKQEATNTPKLSATDRQFIIDNYNNYTSTELADKFQVSRGMITKLWYDNNLHGKSKKSNAKGLDLTGYKVNELTVIEKTDKRDASGGVLWLCQCSCGNTVLVSASRLKNGKAKSCGCLSKAALNKGRKAADLTNQRFGKLIALSRCEDKVFDSGNAVQWICQCDCGRQTKVLASNLITGNTQSCGLCGNNSHGNLKIAQILKDNNITFEQEKRFDTCKDKSYLPFDFYVNNQYLIEYDGKQHFLNTGSFYEDYENIHRRDNIKNQWCKDNNIPLIRIPYTHFDEIKIEDLLLETSNYIIE